MAIDHDLDLLRMAARLLDMRPQTLRKYERLAHEIKRIAGMVGL